MVLKDAYFYNSGWKGIAECNTLLVCFRKCRSAGWWYFFNVLLALAAMWPVNHRRVTAAGEDAIKSPFAEEMAWPCAFSYGEPIAVVFWYLFPQKGLYAFPTSRFNWKCKIFLREGFPKMIDKITLCKHMFWSALHYGDETWMSWLWMLSHAQGGWKRLLWKPLNKLRPWHKLEADPHPGRCCNVLQWLSRLSCACLTFYSNKQSLKFRNRVFCSFSLWLCWNHALFLYSDSTMIFNHDNSCVLLRGKDFSCTFILIQYKLKDAWSNVNLSVHVLAQNTIESCYHNESV